MKPDSMLEPAVSLDDKYSLDADRALIGGRQALVRLPIVQRERDRRQGLNTAGLISGYRGSPLGSYDMELWKAAAILKEHDILFQPGLNEDLALTALGGAQQLDFVPGRKVDGVFGIWYGKGPGVDRSGDAIKHVNLQGVAPQGGILLAFGDDHTGKSSTTAHQSDLTLASWSVPVLYPSSVGDILELGLAGIAMSRFSGLIVGLKLVNETADGTGVIEFDTVPDFILPELDAPPGGVHIRREVRAMQEQDARLVRYKLPRAQAFARANRLDRITFGAASPRFLIATAGKAYGDVLAALAALGLDEEHARLMGIGIYKIALIFPLDPVGFDAATLEADEVFFVEEKRAHAETQAKTLLYNRTRRIRISGKTTPEGEPLLPADLPLDGLLVAQALAARLAATYPEIGAALPGFVAASVQVRERLDRPAARGSMIARRPAFCPGCPHNTSTQVPTGSFGATGIGCHTMVLFHPERNPIPMGHMGAEGANWIGLSPFTETAHIFQNLGDGTFSHSGSLAIRAAVLAGVNITYKILLNDAVAMTGGQPVEGRLSANRVVQQVQAEGVSHVVVLSDQPERFAGADALPTGTELRHRDELNLVQEALRQKTGVNVIVYDQTCAAEKRRRRKLHTYPDPDQRIFINALVCEGCGDCSVQSNCVAIQPLETELGRKRKIDQSACNKDFSCVKGFCPSFVTVEGARPRRTAEFDLSAAATLPEPQLPPFGAGFDLVIAGIGGTGVVTISALLGMAARTSGLGATLYDMTGLSQKGGQVFSHIRLRPDPKAVVAAHIGAGEADVVLACDLVAAAQWEVLYTIAPGKTFVVGNTDTMATADFQSQRDLALPQQLLIDRLTTAGGRAPATLPAAALSEELLGDSIAANMIMLGYAWQRGVIPLSLESIDGAIKLNGKAAKANLEAFAAGRLSTLTDPSVPTVALTLDEFIARRTADLTRYWNLAYAERYTTLLRSARSAAKPIEGGDAFVWAVARSAYKLMAYKDEYEVARLYADGRFREALKREFDDIRKVKVHLAPPFLARPDRRSGRPRKIAFGPWILPLLGVLARCKFLREGALDPFTRSADRRLEQSLRDSFLNAITRLSRDLTADSLVDAIAIARAPLEVRGFGPVKEAAARSLLSKLHDSASQGN